MSTISNSWTGMTALASAQLGTVAATDSALATAPANLLPDTFRSWTLEKQDSYLTRHGSPLTLGSAVTSRPLEVKRSGEPAFLMKITTPKSDGTASLAPTLHDVTAEVGLVSRARTEDFAKAPDKLPPSTFLSWTRDEQLRYAEANGFGAIGSTKAIGGSTGLGTLYVGVVNDIEMESGPVYGNSAATGGAASIPYYHLNGSANGMPSQIVLDQAERLFPTIDGDAHRLDAADRPTSFYKETADPNDPRPLRPDSRLKGFYTNPTELTTDALAEAFMKDFSTWHSGFQVEFVKQHGSGDPKRLILPPNSTEPVLAAMISTEDDAKLYILSALDKAAFARMTLVDQSVIATLPGFKEVADVGGLKAVTDPKAVVTDLSGKSSTPVDPTTAANNLIDYINNKLTINGSTRSLGRTAASSSSENPQSAAEKAAGIYYTDRLTIATEVRNPPLYISETVLTYTWDKRQGGVMPDPDKTYFTVQIDILKDQLSKMAIVSPAEITKRLQEVKDRFERAFAFFDVKPETTIYAPMGIPAANAVMYQDVISLDGNKTINQGYKVFIAQEKRLAETLAERAKIAKDNGTLYGRQLDAPELVFRFQSLYNLQLEAQVVMDTEEVNQQNALLKTYAKIQDIINETLSKFKKTDEDGKYMLGQDVDALVGDGGAFTPEQRKAISMFDDLLGRTANDQRQKHPIETLRGLNRPDFNYISHYNFDRYGSGGGGDDRNYDLNALTHLQWQGFGTRLSEAVTIINQNSQIKMNDINSTDKQRNRHFELANSALSKLNEMIGNIARAG